MDWKAGEFAVKVADPVTGDPVDRKVAGWIKSHWALDFRVFNVGDDWEDWLRGGWTLTHVATGMRAFGFLMPLDEAKDAADFVDTLADWSFTDPAYVSKLRGVAGPVHDKYGDDVVRQKSAFAPTFHRPKNIEAPA